jgi:hypothetical protein
MRQRIAISPEARPYLETLRLLPADIRLSMMTRQFDLGDAHFCICGWALREIIARAWSLSDAESVNDEQRWSFMEDKNVPGALATVHGAERGWSKLYGDAELCPDLVEEAFTIALMEAAEGRELV